MPEGVSDDQQEQEVVYSRMGDYKEFQFGTLLVITLGLTELLMLWLFMNGIGTTPMTLGIFLLVTGILLISVLLFYGMTTVVAGDTIVLSFGIGLIRKTIDLSNVREAVIIKNPWYYGWGIRYIPHGMLYNVSGPDGVELRFTTGGRIVRIGTKDPVHLHAALSWRLGAREKAIA